MFHHVVLAQESCISHCDLIFKQNISQKFYYHYWQKSARPPPKAFQKFANTHPHSGIRERIRPNKTPLTLINREHIGRVTWHVPLKIIVIQPVGGSDFGAQLQSLRWRDQKCSISFSSWGFWKSFISIVRGFVARSNKLETRQILLTKLAWAAHVMEIYLNATNSLRFQSS